jgi:hypothetical protein
LNGYAPFYRFELPHSSELAEPLALVDHARPGAELIINPDRWLFKELQEKIRTADLGGILGEVSMAGPRDGERQARNG